MEHIDKDEEEHENTNYVKKRVGDVFEAKNAVDGSILDSNSQIEIISRMRDRNDLI